MQQASGMSKRLQGRPVLLLLTILSVSSSGEAKYWSVFNDSSVDGKFNKDLGCLTGLPIPDVLPSIPYCNATCQSQEKSYIDYLCTITNYESWSGDLTFCDARLHHCDYDGVICLQESKHVIAIDLSDSQVHGICMKGVEKLRYILALCFDANDCKDKFSDIAHKNLKYLMGVNFGDTNVHGTLPSMLFQSLPLLFKISLYGTQIHGDLPSDLVRLQMLENLDISGTAINPTSVTSNIGSLANLRSLLLDDLNLFGELVMLKNLSKLEHLSLIRNQFYGCIPLRFSEWFPKLQFLYLEHNNLGCQIPTTIQNMTDIQIMRFSGNAELGGLVPRSINILPRLRVFDISRTSILGFEDGVSFATLSSFIAKDCEKFVLTLYELKQALRSSRGTLKYLQIRNTQLQGNLLWFHIEKFPKLTVLDLSENKKLTGGLAKPIKKNTNLVRIDVSQCDLNQDLPLRNLYKLSELASLDVRGNHRMRGTVKSQFIAFDYNWLSTVWDGANYECPQVKLRDTELTLHVDSDYFDRQPCVCLNGFYGQGGYCKRCMEGGICRKNKATFNSSHVAFPIETVMRMREGYKPTPSLHHVHELTKCRSFSMSKDKNYDFICYLNYTSINGSSEEITHCLRNFTCPVGYRGKLCLHCQPGYYEQTGRCLKCEGNKTVLGAAAASLVFFCVTLTLWLWCRHNSVPLVVISLELITAVLLSAFQVIPGWLAKMYVVMAILSFSGRGTSSKGILKISVVLVQLVEALFFQPTGPIHGPNIVDYIFGVFSFRINSVECIIPIRLSVTDKYALNMVFPVFVSVVIWVAFGLWTTVKRTKCEMTNQVAGYLSRLTIIIFNLAYFPIVQKTLILFNSCLLDENDQCRTVDRETWCPANKAYLVVSLASIGTVLYVIGIPFTFACLLYKNRAKIKSDNEEIASWLGPLFLPYRHQHRIGMYMEIVLLLRRLLIAILLVFLGDHVTLQSFLLSIVFLVSLILETRLKPFKIIQFWKQGNGIAEDGKKRPKMGVENVIELAGLSLLLLGVVWIRMPLLARRLQRTDLYWVWDVILTMFACLALIGIIVALRRLCCGNMRTGEKSLLLSVFSTTSTEEEKLKLSP